MIFGPLACGSVKARLTIQAKAEQPQLAGYGAVNSTKYGGVDEMSIVGVSGLDVTNGTLVPRMGLRKAVWSSK